MELLLNFRLTGTAYRDVCYRLATEHLVVQQSSRGLLLASSRGELPLISSPPLKRSHLKKTPDYFKFCRVLDITAPFRSECSVLLEVLSNIEVVRFLPSPKRFFTHRVVTTASTVVAFGTYPFIQFPMPCDELRWCGPRLTPVTKVVYNVSSFVQHGTYIPHRVDHSSWKELVLVFTLHDHTCSKDDFNCMEAITYSLRSVLDKVRDVVLTLVDFDLVPLESVNYARVPVERAGERRARLVQELGDLACRIVFMTSREYRAQVGWESFQTETREKLWTCI